MVLEWIIQYIWPSEKKLSEEEYMLIKINEAIKTYEKDFNEIQNYLFPGLSIIDTTALRTLKESDQHYYMEYNNIKYTLLQCYYYKQYLTTDISKYHGKWIYLVGNGIWNKKTFDSQDEAIDEGASDPNKGIPKVIFTTLIKDKNIDLNTFIYYSKKT